MGYYFQKWICRHRLGRSCAFHVEKEPLQARLRWEKDEKSSFIICYEPRFRIVEHAWGGVWFKIFQRSGEVLMNWFLVSNIASRPVACLWSSWPWEEATSNPTGHPGLVDLVCWCLSWTWEMAQKIVSDTSSLLRMLLFFLIQDDWSPTVILKIRTSCEQSPQLRMSPAPWWFFSMLQQCPDPCFSENIFNVVSVRMRNMNIDSRSCICVWRMSKVKIN